MFISYGISDSSHRVRGLASDIINITEHSRSYVHTFMHYFIHLKYTQIIYWDIMFISYGISDSSHRVRGLASDIIGITEHSHSYVHIHIIL
jgi:hypothetical protein